MEDRDIPNIFNGRKEILLYPSDSDPATAVPLGEVVADSTTILSEDESLHPTSENLSFKVELDNPAEILLLRRHPDVQRCLDYAKGMLDEIKAELNKFYRTAPPRNRKERRERAKVLKKKINRFNAYCRAKGIEISSK